MRKTIHQKINLEPNDSATLFGIRPMLNAKSAHRFAPQPESTNDGTLFRPDSRVGDYEYEVISDADPSGSAAPRVSARRWRQALAVDPRGTKATSAQNRPTPGRQHRRRRQRRGHGSRPRAWKRICAIPASSAIRCKWMSRTGSVDPVEDFLVNRKEGHCEYFASALALLLRSVAIPSRVVNGFKGGDWNDLTQTLNVRQKHAHSWVEAYAGIGDDRLPIWITLDPTPSNERQKSIAQVGGLAGNFRPLTDVIRHIWVFYIVGFDGDRQDKLLYSPMKTLLFEVRNQYIRLGQLLRNWFSKLFVFQSMGAFISIRGFIVTFVVLTLLAGLANLVFRLAQRFFSWLRGPRLDATSLTAGILFYRRLTQMLAAYELDRNPAETQSEFAGRAHKFLTGKGSPTQPVADVPREVVDAFYRVRFGHLELEPDSLHKLDARLDALESSLQNP